MTITEVYYAAQSHAMKKPGYNTGRPSYLKVQGNGGNTSSYPKFDIQAKCDATPI